MASKQTPTILVVDDEESITFCLKILFEAEGYDVLTACDGKTAIDLATSRHPDLILLDIVLPHVDGYTVCQTLRQDRTTQDIPIIMLSARSRKIDIAKGLALGATAYVTKPFSSQSLLEKSRTMLTARETALHG